MLDWLAILGVAAALLGVWRAPQVEGSNRGLQGIALWTLASVAGATALAGLVDALAGTRDLIAYRPLLAGLSGCTLAWLLARHFDTQVSQPLFTCLFPLIGLLAAGSAWLALMHAATLAGVLAYGLLAAVVCALGLAAGAAFHARLVASAQGPGRVVPRLALALGAVLLALSALSTVG